MIPGITQVLSGPDGDGNFYDASGGVVIGQELDRLIIEQFAMTGTHTENSVYHSGSIGDVWASLPAVKKLAELTKKKITYYLRPNIHAYYYDGATHPTKDENGTQVMLNKKMIEMMIPLLEAQPYIQKAEIHTTQPIWVPLTKFRHTEVGMPYHDLRKWYFYTYPNIFCDDLYKPYIFIPDAEKDFAKGKLIVARSERYRNADMNYGFLKQYEGQMIFAGTKLEYVDFCARFDVEMPLLKIDNFLELAQALKQCVGMISNQTMLFQIAEGMKINRMVEICKMAPNVCVQGPNGYESGYNWPSIEYWVGEFFKKGSVYDKKKAADGQPD